MGVQLKFRKMLSSDLLKNIWTKLVININTIHLLFFVVFFQVESFFHITGCWIIQNVLNIEKYFKYKFYSYQSIKSWNFSYQIVDWFKVQIELTYIVDIRRNRQFYILLSEFYFSTDNFPLRGNFTWNQRRYFFCFMIETGLSLKCVI